MYLCRYPFLSSEIFSCELSQFLEKFFEAPEELRSPSPQKQEGTFTLSEGDNSLDGNSGDLEDTLQQQQFSVQIQQIPKDAEESKDS